MSTAAGTSVGRSRTPPLVLNPVSPCSSRSKLFTDKLNKANLDASTPRADSADGAAEQEFSSIMKRGSTGTDKGAGMSSSHEPDPSLAWHAGLIGLDPRGASTESPTHTLDKPKRSSGTTVSITLGTSPPTRAPNPLTNDRNFRRLNSSGLPSPFHTH
eukprot:TRINITY_DN1514_c0_g1_i2.p1 TRINITY_DN1514_c0_g1~~TRINITY_DN1514_c0_g1_i2.p1  ORF type:complete len:158 (+),score=5.85 TRINITY_DN1514_c0_g1_i2:299-772(+)